MAISPNVLSGLAAALGGGMKAFNTQRAEDEQTRQFDAEQERQNRILARMISRDELDEFKTQEDVTSKKFDRAMTTAQQFGGQRLPESAVADLPQNMRDLISKPAMSLESRQISGQLGGPVGEDAGGINLTKSAAAPIAGQVDINMPESERARIAQGNQLASLQRAGLMAGGRDADRDASMQRFLMGLTQSQGQHQDRLAATYAGIAARGQGGGRGSTKIVTGSDENGRPVSYLVDSDSGDIIRSYDKPLSNQERTAQTNSAASLDTINDIVKMYKDEYVGPVEGRATTFSNKYGVSTPWSENTPESAEFGAAVARYKNKMINKITGAAVGVQEEKRIMGEIPDMNDPPTTFKAKLRLTQENEKMLDGILQKRTSVRPGASGAPAQVPAAAGPKKPYEIVSVK